VISTMFINRKEFGEKETKCRAMRLRIENMIYIIVEQFACVKCMHFGPRTC